MTARTVTLNVLPAMEGPQPEPRYERGCRCYRCAFIDAARAWATGFTGQTDPAMLALILADAADVIRND